MFPNPLQNNAAIILRVLAEQPRPEGGNAEVTGPRLAEITGLTPNDINDAITILIEAGFVEWLQTLVTGTYDFNVVWITARGRYELERMAIRPEAGRDEEVQVIRPPSPVGSPFGFTDTDWETVADRKSRKDTLFIVLGYQFMSDFYDSDQLVANVQAMFETAVAEYNQLPNSYHVTLDFHALRAGYGEHLFNEIARDIISADIAVFETSDLNPNVMVELGVALTWDVRVLPIKREGQRIPPSDISGQTWADYRDNASDFVDPDHSRKLVRMVERAARKKGHV
jgi:DNA-binding MarR family transcriptional regulator